MDIEAFYDPATSTLSYLISDPATRDAVVIDPVLDYDPGSSTVSHASLDRIHARLLARELRLGLIVESHAHADHLSGSQALKRRHPGAQVAISSKITIVQRTFKEVFELPADFPTDGRQFDRLLDHGERVTVGSLSFEVIHTPGHTPACACFLFGDALFTGDTMFMPDMGTGRCDFPAGSADDLYSSITELIYTLPDDTRVFVGHDYQPGGRDLAYETTVGEQKRSNKHLPASRSRADFVAFRIGRDAGLSAPRLLFQSVQVNVDAGTLPPESRHRRRFLKIPINAFHPASEPESETIELGDASTAD